MADGKGNVATTRTISLIALVACIATTGCSQTSRANPRESARVDAITERQVEKFNNELLSAWQYGRDKGWELRRPILPDNNERLIRAALLICTILDENEGDPEKINDKFFDGDASKSELDFNIVVSKAAATGFCPEYRKRVNKWFSSLK